MKNKSTHQLGRKASFLALAGLALAGCATLPSGKGGIYQNPVVSPSYGYAFNEKSGDVKDVSPYIKDRILYIVGYSGVCASESLARDIAIANAMSKLSRLTDESTVSGLSTKSSEIDYVEKNGTQGYAVKVLTRTPLSSLDQNALKNLESALTK